ncbi:MAG: B12-binding domain-containing radical SAM protein [Candidatus Electronema sp. V4]|uniref:B12-binding domain-containing radical SAM protein n=1 Tax=Candidatus Electronema sp. V4 TaxID=3454756 RepID=UPI0040554C32
MVNDLDSLPFPARDLIPFEKYVTRSQRNVHGGYRSASIISSRGCPYDCEFCSIHSVVARRWRKRSAENVLAEIELLVNKYNINLIEFEDDMLTLDRDRILKIMEGIINLNKKGKRIAWQAANGIRFDTLDEELILKFKEANVRHFNLALEHGDKDVLKLINKKLDLEKVREVVRLLDKHKITAGVFVIYGYPGETKERFNNAVKFYKEIKQLYRSLKFAFFIAQPYPNTRLFQRCVQQGYLPADLFDHIDTFRQFSTSRQVWIKTEDFDENEILKRKRVLYRQVYGKIGYAKNIVRENFPSLLMNIFYYIYYSLERTASFCSKSRFLFKRGKSK